MIVAIHQPNYIPWLGYFHKILRCDQFVFLDDVQYTKNSYINRNRIKTNKGVEWLTIPVRATGRFGQLICETKTAWEHNWPRKHLNALQAHYGRGPFFDEVFPIFEGPLRRVGPETSISELNAILVEAICGYIGISCTFVRSSELHVSGKGADLLVAILQRLGAAVYLSGSGGAKYQDEYIFAGAGIRLEYSNFKTPFYRQAGKEFVPNLSVIDALMNCGRSTKHLLETGRPSASETTDQATDAHLAD